jgi:phage terminase Nu1 subunit (DNA packaging protein)
VNTVNAELPAGNEVLQKDFAAMRGISPAMVAKLKSRGRLVMNDAGDRVLVKESIERIELTRDPGRGGDRTAKVPAPSPLSAAVGNVLGREGVPPGTQGDLSYNVQAAREKLASAQLRELELAEKAGRLVPASQVEALVFDQARLAREALMSIPDRVATILAAETDAAVVHAKLSAECRKVCEMLSTQPDASPDATSA